MIMMMMIIIIIVIIINLYDLNFEKNILNIKCVLEGDWIDTGN